MAGFRLCQLFALSRLQELPDDAVLSQRLETVMDELNLPLNSRATIRAMPRAMQVRQPGCEDSSAQAQMLASC